MVRCFEDADVHHVNGKVDPAEDAETINFELALADVTQIEKRLERLKKGRAKSKEEQASNEVSMQSEYLQTFISTSITHVLCAIHMLHPHLDLQLSTAISAAYLMVIRYNGSVKKCAPACIQKVLLG